MVSAFLAVCFVVGGGSKVAADEPSVQDCEVYVDRTAVDADGDLSWGFSIASDPERCIQIAVGQQVRWIGSFGSHPLDPEGGALPNPIATHQEGVVTFTQPGTYGYVCGFHPVMRGAVRVVAPTPPSSTNWIDTNRSQVNQLTGTDVLNHVLDALIHERLSLSGGINNHNGSGSSAAERMLTGSPNVNDGEACTPNDTNGVPEANPGCQEIAPMARPLGSGVCDDDPATGVSGDPNTEAEGLAFCADVVTFVAANDSLGAYGEDAQACADFHALGDQTPNAGHAFPDRRVGNLRHTGTLPSGTPISDWKTVLRLLYTGCASGTCDNQTAVQRLARCGRQGRGGNRRPSVQRHCARQRQRGHCDLRGRQRAPPATCGDVAPEHGEARQQPPL